VLTWVALLPEVARIPLALDRVGLHLVVVGLLVLVSVTARASVAKREILTIKLRRRIILPYLRRVRLIVTVHNMREARSHTVIIATDVGVDLTFRCREQIRIDTAVGCLVVTRSTIVFHHTLNLYIISTLIEAMLRAASSTHLCTTLVQNRLKCHLARCLPMMMITINLLYWLHEGVLVPFILIDCVHLSHFILIIILIFFRDPSVCK